MSWFTAGRRVSFVVALAGAMLFSAAGPAAAASEADAVRRIARAQLGDAFRMGAEGPYRFDCSGLVYFAFSRAGLVDRIGNRRLTARGYLDWFRARGAVTTSNPHPGDLVMYERAEHMGIYLGDGKAISALVNPYGVSVHPVKGYINKRFKAYLHVRLNR